jgi:hypothetical protein
MSTMKRKARTITSHKKKSAANKVAYSSHKKKSVARKGGSTKPMSVTESIAARPAPAQAPPPAPAVEPEYQPSTLPPTTDKEWANAKFKRPTCFVGEMMFHSQTIGMFTMKTDAGKTNFTIGLGLAMAYGKTFCEWSPVNRARVLYIEGESPKYRMQDIIRAQRRALGIRDEDVSSNFTLITRQSHGDIPFLHVPERSPARGDNPRRDQQEKAALVWLNQLIEKYEPNFIIFDSIQSLAPIMVSASARGWITQLMKPIAEGLNKRNIGQLWLHHPDKSGKAQHGTGARNWGLSLELYGVPIRNRGICFNLTFPGKKKDDLGDNEDFNDRSVQFNDGKWVVGSPITSVDVATKPEAHRPNESAPLALRVLRELVKNDPEVWVSTDDWFEACIRAGISTSHVRAHQYKAFSRARNYLIDQCQVERRVYDGFVRLFPPAPPSELDLMNPESATAGSA